MNMNRKWIRLRIHTRHAHWSKVIRSANWIWTEINWESWSGSDNRIALRAATSDRLLLRPPERLQKYCDESVCLCVCLSVREDISGTTRASLKPNSITLYKAGHRQVRASNLSATSFEPASVMEFGFYQTFCVCCLCPWLGPRWR